MSIKMITWAWQLPISHGDKLVLMALADHSDDGGFCWPGTKGIAEKCNLSRQTIFRHLNNLERAGFIERQARWRDDGSRASNTYQLCIERPKLLPPRNKTLLPSNKIYPPQGIKTLLGSNKTLPLEPSIEPSLRRGNVVEGYREDDLKGKCPTVIGAAPPPKKKIDSEFLDRLAAVFPRLDVGREHERFKDWQVAKGRQFKNDQAAFRNWLRKAEDFLDERQGKGESDGAGGSVPRRREVTPEFRAKVRGL